MKLEPNKLALALVLTGCWLPTAGVAAGEPANNQQTVNADFLRPGESRSFHIQYVAKLSEIPAGTKQLRVWLPVPQDSTVQTIKGLKFSQTAKLNTENKYGNRMAYFELSNPSAAVNLTMDFDCTRKEIRVDLDKLQSEGKDPSDAHLVFRQPDKLVLVDDEMRTLARQLTAGQTTTLAKARAIYDYTLGRMSYDKNHLGWGLGSTRHACDVGKGNCTDFHALFNSLCRAAGIASGFEIGLYLPYEKGKDEPLGGYHCWAFFRVPGRTWVPVDASEADRFAEYREFFFGGHTANRVTLSTGRDLTLVPKQAGEPLNYFLNPHAEADGKAVKSEKSWSYRELN